MTLTGSHTLTLNDNSVHYRSFGSSESPPMVLVHGLYGDSAGIALLAERFADQFLVIAPDALGHGRSARPEHFTLIDQGQMLNALTAALGYDAVPMVGISMGSYLTAQAAILEPARVSRLVLVVSKAHGTTSSSRAYAQRMGFDLSTATQEQAMEFLAGALWSRNTTAESRAAISNAIAAQPDSIALNPEEQAAVERSLAGFDLRPQLDRIAAPTLVIAGADDGLNPPTEGEELVRGIANAHMTTYDSSGHLLAFEETDRFVADVVAFIRGD